MNVKRTLGTALLVAGVIIVIISVAADYIGMGAFPAFGYKQIIGAIVGIVMIVVGSALLPRRAKVIE